MNRITIFFLFSLSHLAPFAVAQNVAMTSLTDGPIPVATSSSSGGLVARIAGADILVDPPQDITAFTDVSIDGGLVFALSVSPQRVCSYSIATDTPSLTLINCVGSTFAASPFCGISSLGGTLFISGGTGGVTVFDYDTSTGVLEQSPRILNFDLQVIGNPDVVMVNPTQAALSSDIGGSPRFGSIVVNINGTTLTPVGEFRNPNSLGFDNALGPSNFPFVNAVYTDANGNVLLYTANGGMSVQNINVADSTVEIAAPVSDFQAVTVAVNEEYNLVVFGGLVQSGESVLYAFSIQDDMGATLLGQAQVGGRITSVATSGNVVSFVTQVSTMQTLAIEEMTTLMPTDPSASPPTEDAPTLSPPVPSPTMQTAADTSDTSSGSQTAVVPMFFLLVAVSLAGL